MARADRCLLLLCLLLCACRGVQMFERLLVFCLQWVVPVTTISCCVCELLRPGDAQQHPRQLWMHRAHAHGCCCTLPCLPIVPSDSVHAWARPSAAVIPIHTASIYLDPAAGQTTVFGRRWGVRGSAACSGSWRCRSARPALVRTRPRCTSFPPCRACSALLRSNLPSHSNLINLTMGNLAPASPVMW
jgi:hypothetical protein